MLRIEVASNLTLDLDNFKEEGFRATILARSGGGKSNLVALIIEQLLSYGHQVCIIEPITEYYTLKSMFNYVVWVADDGDILLHPEAPTMYSELLERGASMILSVGDIEDEYREKMFVFSFLQSVYQRWKRIRRPLFLVIEDAEGYAPQMWSREDRPCLGVMALLAKRGRKLGINLICASQRPAELHKSVWSQSNILFLGGFKASRDLETIREMAKLLHLPLDASEVARFMPGEFYAIVGGEVHRIHAYMRKTPHGGATPELKPLPPEYAPVLSELKAKIDELVRRKREEEDLVKKLRKRIEELERENEELRRKLEVMEVVKEIPLEIKAETEPITIPIPQGVVDGSSRIPEIVHKCPYKGAVKVYEYLAKTREYAGIGEIAAMTGVSMANVKKIVRYFRRKGLVRTKTKMLYGRQHIAGVKLKAQ